MQYTVSERHYFRAKRHIKYQHGQSQHALRDVLNTQKLTALITLKIFFTHNRRVCPSIDLYVRLTLPKLLDRYR